MALLELVKATLFNTTPHLPEETDWDEVLLEAKHQAVLALAAPSVPKEEAHKWKPYVYQNTAHYMQVLHCQKQLIHQFDTAGIPLVILKGTAAAIYYPSPIQRTMGDIDFLVPQDQFDVARELMEESGYAARYGSDEDSRHIGFAKHGIVFEMHRFFSSFGLDIEPAIMGGFSRRQNASVLGCEFPMLPTLENGLVLLAHIRQHILEEQYSLGLRQVIDWMMYVHVHISVDGWKDAFMKLARQYKLDTLAATVTSICKKRLGIPDDVDWAADEATVEELFVRIMASGNFSAKKDRKELRDKPVQTAVMNLKEHGVFRYLQWAGKENWKATRRYQILIPFAWIYQVFHFIAKGLGRIRKGKPLIEEMAEGKKNNEFLGRLGI